MKDRETYNIPQQHSYCYWFRLCVGYEYVYLISNNLCVLQLEHYILQVDEMGVWSTYKR